MGNVIRSPHFFDAVSEEYRKLRNSATRKNLELVFSDLIISDKAYSHHTKTRVCKMRSCLDAFDAVVVNCCMRWNFVEGMFDS